MRKILTKNCFVAIFLFSPVFLFAQNAYFVDGFHGGVWGHYPVGYTSFLVEQLNQHPSWNINLEIEPETWDREIKQDVIGYNALKEFLKDNTVKGRIEYVNPTYAQPYMFNISGESIIRQFSYGMGMLKSHFPELVFKTYSSEEPCFTSALPQILKSFGYQYASLKNPNTCWGGYTRAHGKELVNWVGPDGASILTSPRYAIEALKPESTWETIGNGNSSRFVSSAFKDGIKNPVGMCLQDAGWRFGPWLKDDFYKPTIYTTWRNYFENIAAVKKVPDWKFSQEDVLTSLVWGAQVVQQLAQQTRASENLIVQAEKVAVIDKIDNNFAYPAIAIDEAWRNLMLAQHHDCWIVPYNGKDGDTWADKAKSWTNRTNNLADSIKNRVAIQTPVKDVFYFRVYNTSGRARNEWVTITSLARFTSSDHVVITDGNKEVVPAQLLQTNSIVFKAKVPAMGYAVFEIRKTGKKVDAKGAKVVFDKNGDCILETDLYIMHIDKTKGGTIKSLVAKKLDGKDFVDSHSERKFNELRGNFYKKGGFYSSAGKPAKISVLENGPYQISVKVESEIADNQVSQIITLIQGQPLIDCHLEIQWRQNEGIGEFEETRYKDTSLRKAFYNDQYKLLTQFPLALKNQKVFKNAPFDVTESELDNTFFSSWDSIKNNIVLDWVDVVSGDQKYGMTLFLDHTTSYAHGKDFPLGLTTQYSGKGLWGRNYTIKNNTQINYQLLPHKGNWQQAGVSDQNTKIKEPLYAVAVLSAPGALSNSFIEISSAALEISSCTYKGDDLYIRVFNAAKTAALGKISLNFDAVKATFVNLDGSKPVAAKLINQRKGKVEIPLTLPPFGITTLKVQKHDKTI